jgi:hypothetical protein
VIHGRQQQRQQHGRIAAVGGKRLCRWHPRSQTPTNGSELRKQSLSSGVVMYEGLRPFAWPASGRGPWAPRGRKRRPASAPGRTACPACSRLAHETLCYCTRRAGTTAGGEWSMPWSAHSAWIGRARSGTLLIRLIPYGAGVEPLVAVRPVGQVRISGHRPLSPAPGSAGTGQGGPLGRRGGGRNGWRVGRPVGGRGRPVG